MPTVSTTMSTHADLLRQNVGSTTNYHTGAASAMAIGEATNVIYYGGWRFQNVAVANGVTVTLATITKALNSVVGSPAISIYGVNVDSCAAFGSGNKPSTAPRTAASTSMVNSSTQTVTNQAQGIVNRAGWASGNNMGFVFINTHNQSTSNYFQAQAFNAGAPVLAITYLLAATQDPLLFGMTF